MPVLADCSLLSFPLWSNFHGGSMSESLEEYDYSSVKGGGGGGASFLAFHVHKERPLLTALPFSLSDHKENGRGVYNSGLLMCISFSKGWLTEYI